MCAEDANFGCRTSAAARDDPETSHTPKGHFKPFEIPEWIARSILG